MHNFKTYFGIAGNVILYDLCDWKIGDFSVVANRLLNVCRLY